MCHNKEGLFGLSVAQHKCIFWFIVVALVFAITFGVMTGGVEGMQHNHANAAKLANANAAANAHDNPCYAGLDALNKVEHANAISGGFLGAAALGLGVQAVDLKTRQNRTQTMVNGENWYLGKMSLAILLVGIGWLLSACLIGISSPGNYGQGTLWTTCQDGAFVGVIGLFIFTVAGFTCAFLGKWHNNDFEKMFKREDGEPIQSDIELALTGAGSVDDINQAGSDYDDPRKSTPPTGQGRASDPPGPRKTSSPSRLPTSGKRPSSKRPIGKPDWHDRRRMMRSRKPNRTDIVLGRILDEINSQ